MTISSMAVPPVSRSAIEPMGISIVLARGGGRSLRVARSFKPPSSTQVSRMTRRFTTCAAISKAFFCGSLRSR